MCIAIPLAVGALIAIWAKLTDRTDVYGRTQSITTVEFAVSALVIMMLSFAVTVFIGPGLARSSAVKGYKEYWNGSITQVRVDRTTCRKDGSCYYEYDCDPYQVKVVDRAAYSDKDGYHPEQSHYETRYHECPYVTAELDYVVDDSLGRTITIGGHYFEASPRRWSYERGIPSRVPRQPPNRWLVARQHLASGAADPVTKVASYPNYILASDTKLFRKYDGAVASYLKSGLLPKRTTAQANGNLYDYDMRIDKVQVVGGLKVANLPLWQDSLMRLNAALGSNLQGDLHIVLVPASKVTDSARYITALKAHWQQLGKWSISKNGIMLALGVSPDGSTVEWARSATGMPVGNGTMVTALDTRLNGLALDPKVLLGSISASVGTSPKIKIAYDQSQGGVIGQTILVDYPFERPCMECKGKEDKGVGFVEMKDLVPVSTGAKIWMFIIILVLSSALWVAALMFDPFGVILDKSNN